jgi:hypothetical protein
MAFTLKSCRSSRVSESGAPNPASNSNCFSIRIESAFVLSVMARHNSSSVNNILGTAVLTHYIVRESFSDNKANITLMPRRFPPPWSIEEGAACFIVRDHNK